MDSLFFYKKESPVIEKHIGRGISLLPGENLYPLSYFYCTYISINNRKEMVKKGV